MRGRHLSGISCLVLVAAVLLSGCSAPGSSQDGGVAMTPAALAGFVHEAAEFAGHAGKETALSEFNRKDGAFSRGDLYLYAYDFNGTLLAHPHLKEAIGTSLIGRTDPFGMKNIQALVNTARSGGGFTVFVWPNPGRENRQEMKIGYVLPVDDRWWLGSGVYLSEVTGMDTSFPLPTP